MWHGGLLMRCTGAGDVGDTPLELLEGVLDVCDAAQLAQIEDETRDGGRDVAPDLCPHWKRCLSQDYGLPHPDVQACSHCSMRIRIPRARAYPQDTGLISMRMHVGACMWSNGPEVASQVQELPLLHAEEAGQQLVDWRALYQWKQGEYERAKQASAQRMRALWAQEDEQKSSRCAQVPCSWHSRTYLC